MDFPSHVVITGASGGIGSALAKAYAKQGVHLSLFGRKRDELETVSKACQCKLATVSIYTVDVTDTGTLQKTLSDIDNNLPVDLLIANAGVANHLSTDDNEENWRNTKTLLDVNVMGAFATVSPLITRMRQRKKGQIALMGSIAGFYGFSISPAYCASKAALKTYSEALRELLRKDGVGVSVILPGFVKSNMSDRLETPKPFLMSADKAAQIIKKGLARNKARIAFPLLLYAGMRFATMLPYVVGDFILSRLGKIQ